MELRDFFGVYGGRGRQNGSQYQSLGAALNIELWTMSRDVVTQAARFMFIEHFNMYN